MAMLVALTILAGGTLAAQGTDQVFLPSYNSLSSINGGFIDLSRLTMRQSFSMSYLSSGRGSLVTNLYRNNIGYRLTDHLEMNLDLAYRFTPSQTNSLWSLSEGQNSLFIPSFGIKYQPSRSIMLELQYNQVDPLQFGSYPWYRRY
jgi:hypothetical protein